MAVDWFGIEGTDIASVFRVESVVAEGGFAVVYRAYHTGFRVPVALKCLKIPGGMAEGQRTTFVERFRAEAEILLHLSGAIPEVVRPFHVDAVYTHGGFMPFMALEWLDGETLDSLAERRRLKGEPFRLLELISMLDSVAAALHRAHHFRMDGRLVCVTHRDLKPENLFVQESLDGTRFKILDYGISKVKDAAQQLVGKLSTEDPALTAYTPAYAAPEQWLPQRLGQAGPWTDVWGLALTVTELLVGHPVIQGGLAGMMGTATDPLRRPTPRNEGATVTDEVEAVLQRALAVAPTDRYQRVDEFWADLCEAAGQESAARRVVSSRSGAIAAVRDSSAQLSVGSAGGGGGRETIVRDSSANVPAVAYGSRASAPNLGDAAVVRLEVGGVVAAGIAGGAGAAVPARAPSPSMPDFVVPDLELPVAAAPLTPRADVAPARAAAPRAAEQGRPGKPPVAAFDRNGKQPFGDADGEDLDIELASQPPGSFDPVGFVSATAVPATKRTPDELKAQHGDGTRRGPRTLGGIELSDSLPPAPAYVGPRLAATVAVQRAPVAPRWREHLWGAARWVVAAILVVVAARFWATEMGTPLTLGPVTPAFVAGALFLVGIARGLWGLLSGRP